MFYDQNPAWVVAALIALAHDPYSALRPYFREDRALPLLTGNFEDVLDGIEKNPWKQKNWMLYSANYKIPKHNVMLARIRPNLNDPLTDLALRTTDVFHHYGPILKLMAEVKDGLKQPAFTMAGQAVAINPNIFVGNAGVYLDMLLANDTKTLEPVLMISLRVHLRPPLFPKRSRSFSFLPDFNFGPRFATERSSETRIPDSREQEEPTLIDLH